MLYFHKKNVCNYSFLDHCQAIIVAWQGSVRSKLELQNIFLLCLDIYLAAFFQQPENVLGW